MYIEIGFIFDATVSIGRATSIAEVASIVMASSFGLVASIAPAATIDAGSNY